MASLQLLPDLLPISKAELALAPPPAALPPKTPPSAASFLTPRRIPRLVVAQHDGQPEQIVQYRRLLRAEDAVHYRQRALHHCRRRLEKP